MSGLVGVGRIFSRGVQSGIFPGIAKDFSRGAKDGEISFYPMETKKTTFFC